jgi:hypothetical protein
MGAPLVSFSQFPGSRCCPRAHAAIAASIASPCVQEPADSACGVCPASCTRTQTQHTPDTPRVSTYMAQAAATRRTRRRWPWAARWRLPPRKARSRLLGAQEGLRPERAAARPETPGAGVGCSDQWASGPAVTGPVTGGSVGSGEAVAQETVQAVGWTNLWVQVVGAALQMGGPGGMGVVPREVTGRLISRRMHMMCQL